MKKNTLYHIISRYEKRVSKPRRGNASAERHKTRPEDHCRDYVVHLLIIVLNPRSGTAQNQARRSLPQFISCFNPDTEHKPIQGYIILTSIVLGLPLQHWQFLRNCLFREVHDVNPLQNYIWPFLASIHQMKCKGLKTFVAITIGFLNSPSLVWPSWNPLGNCTLFVHLYPWKSKIKMQKRTDLTHA